MAIGNTNQGSSRCFSGEQFAGRSRELAKGREHLDEGNGSGQEQTFRLRPSPAEVALEIVGRESATGNFLRQRRRARRQDVCPFCEFEGDILGRPVSQKSNREKG